MIQTTKKIKLYNLDNSIQASKWVREETRGIPTETAPQMTNPLNIYPRHYRGNMIQNSLGYFFNGGNNIESNNINTALFTSTYKMGNGLSIIPENFMKVVALFTARKTIKSNWINQKDEYSAPNTDHEDYEQWNNDAIIYSLFNTSSNQSSLRDVDYKEEQWQIENEFFFMGHEEIKFLADEHSYGDCYNDVKQYGKDRYVYNLLGDITLSDDARELLILAKQLVRHTFEYREIMNEEHPNYNLQSWDCGWYQIKLIAKEYCKDELKEFTTKYKEFENRMRDGVYKFEFLRS